MIVPHHGYSAKFLRMFTRTQLFLTARDLESMALATKTDVAILFFSVLLDSVLTDLDDSLDHLHHRGSCRRSRVHSWQLQV